MKTPSNFINALSKTEVSGQEYFETVIFNIKCDWADLIGNKTKVDEELTNDVKLYLGIIKKYLLEHSLELKLNKNYQQQILTPTSIDTGDMENPDYWFNNSVVALETMVSLSIKDYLNIPQNDYSIISAYLDKSEALLNNFMAQQNNFFQKYKQLLQNYHTQGIAPNNNRSLNPQQQMIILYDQLINDCSDFIKKSEQSKWTTYNRLSTDGKLYLDLENTINDVANRNIEQIKKTMDTMLNTKQQLVELSNQTPTDTGQNSKQKPKL